MRAWFILVPLLSGAAAFDHSDWDRVLKKHVNTVGEVDYAALKTDRALLDSYVNRLAAPNPSLPTRQDELAYWLNAYNALVVKAVTDAYPTKSVRDLGMLYGFFRRKEHVLAGQNISLLSLENDTIRKRYGDARIHFAIVCAAISCPLLATTAFTGENVDARLDLLTRQFLAERRNMVIDVATSTLTVSALFDWYKRDYGDVLAFIKKYASDEDRKKIESIRSPRIKHFDYDWSINDPGARARRAR